MSVRCNRCLADGSSIQQVAQRGQVVTLNGLDIPVAVSWFWRRQEETGAREKHFIVATEALSGAYLVRLGKRRWAIEACFKTLKHQIVLVKAPSRACIVGGFWPSSAIC